ncbi:unnamed protein product, partial [Ectocarpus fasciculatus]
RRHPGGRPAAALRHADRVHAHVRAGAQGEGVRQPREAARRGRQSLAVRDRPPRRRRQPRPGGGQARAHHVNDPPGGNLALGARRLQQRQRVLHRQHGFRQGSRQRVGPVGRLQVFERVHDPVAAACGAAYPVRDRSPRLVPNQHRRRRRVAHEAVHPSERLHAHSVPARPVPVVHRPETGRRCLLVGHASVGGDDGRALLEQALHDGRPAPAKGTGHGHLAAVQPLQGLHGGLGLLELGLDGVDLVLHLDPQ